MKTLKLFTTAGAVTALSFSLTAEEFGQRETTRAERTEVREERGAQIQEKHAEALRATDLKGSRVVNAEGERLGTVDDLAIQLEDGTFSYAIIAAGGFLGIGGNLRPVPPEAIQTREVAIGIEVVLDVSEEQWARAPKIERQQMHMLGQENRGQEIYEYFGQDWEARQQRTAEFAAPQREQQVEQDHTAPGIRPEPGHEPQARTEVQRETRERDDSGRMLGDDIELRSSDKINLASDLMSARIDDQNGQELGEIRDFLINLENGQVSFALISTTTGFWEMGNEEYAVSPRALEIRDNRLILNITKEDLETAQTLTRDQVLGHAEEQASISTDEARQSPSVWNYRDDESSPGVFGDPGRERDADQDRNELEREPHEGQQETGEQHPPETGGRPGPAGQPPQY